MGKIIVLFGPSAAGKSEIQKNLSAMNFPKIITATTRQPREYEKDGVHYHFLDRKTFETYMEQQMFVEWTEYNNEWYGTLKSSVEEIIRGNSAGHIIMDLRGVQSLKEQFTNIVSVYIGANIESITRRLHDRNSPESEMNWRLNKALTDELSPSYQAHADYVIWNNDDTNIKDTLNKIYEIL
ncbi:guanylate kinase [Paenibacillus sp. GSMTC-2017]|uniref:guanylate kinase n=1 Tax=Paenibacillus sp. GSMTC-2017 TaxID=2794350 RepID=UPI0018DA2A24|nr:AAA family ATPase [Paenibacillus sp. GSMTC-2017]MBH5319477.1 guanylate kinase [Paenibacillus sp. GSMTC-2017]